MGKKSREKKERRKAKEVMDQAIAAVTGDDEEVTGSGDLRLIEAHVTQWLAGTPEAEAALKMLGRDASLTVMQIGERLKNAEVVEFGKRLVAVKPQFPTNLMALREDSVVQHVARAQSDAPQVSADAELHVGSHTLAIFDPALVADALVKGGKPRADGARVAEGHVAVFSLDPLMEADVGTTTEAVADDQPVTVRRVLVKSGVVFCGPQEASDGPRLGTVRLDPFRTALDDHLERGAFRRVQPGVYKVSAYRTGDEKVRVHFEEAPDAFDVDEGPLPGA